jgi:ceramide glucosyltransferase
VARDRRGARAAADGTVAGTLAGGAAIVGAFGRLVLHARGEDGWSAFWRDLPLVAVRDTLLALEWLAAAYGSQVVWRGARMTVVGGERAPAVEGGDGC